MTGTTSNSERLPYDVGVEAYRERIHYTKNPYQEGDWRHEEWWLGWNSCSEGDPDTWDDETDNFTAAYLAAHDPTNG